MNGDYARITLRTRGGNLVDIVEDAAEAVNNCFVFYQDLERLIDRVHEFGVEEIGSTLVGVLRAEGLIHFKVG